MVHVIRQVNLPGILMLVVLAAGCSTQARRVDCETQLQPINVPAPASVALPEQPAGGEQP